jgi:hypothetical protein
MRSLFAVVLLSSTVSLAQPAEGTAPPEGPQPPDVSKLPFTSDSIRQVMTFHQPKIQACYEDFLRQKEKALEGKLTTAFTVTAEGLVTKARVDRKQSTLRDPGLYDCVVAVLASMEFPKPPAGKEQPVEYPFNLKAIK